MAEENDAQKPDGKAVDPASALFGVCVCECGDKFADLSALAAHKMRHHLLEWPNAADAARRLRENLNSHGEAFITARRDDVETLLGFAEKRPNGKDMP